MNILLNIIALYAFVIGAAVTITGIVHIIAYLIST